MKILEGVYYFFDKLEDRIRGKLSRHPFIYTFIGGVGVVLFWRGVWHIADTLESYDGLGATVFSPFGSVILSILILLATGLFVSIFIGDSIIISGIKKDKKIIDKTIEEVEGEETEIHKTLKLVMEMKEEIEVLEKRSH